VRISLTVRLERVETSLTIHRFLEGVRRRPAGLDPLPRLVCRQSLARRQQERRDQRATVDPHLTVYVLTDLPAVSGQFGLFVAHPLQHMQELVRGLRLLVIVPIQVIVSQAISFAQLATAHLAGRIDDGRDALRGEAGHVLRISDLATNKKPVRHAREVVPRMFCLLGAQGDRPLSSQYTERGKKRRPATGMYRTVFHVTVSCRGGLMEASTAPWLPLAERLDHLPLLLAGPILRRTESRSVTVWVALQQARRVSLRVYQWDATTQTATERLVGSRRTIRLGAQLHVAAVTARAPVEERALQPGALFCYNLFFAPPDAEGDTGSAGHASAGEPDLFTPGILMDDPLTASEVEQLIYPGMPLPSFVLPAATLEQMRLFHGSCRKPHGVGRDALATLDVVLRTIATDALQRPQQLYLTGDQIYADDVAGALLPALMDAAEFLVGPEEVPGIAPEAHLTAPGRRARAVREMARFTTATAQNHLLTRGEYLAMYLFCWSDVLWPDALPSAEAVWQAFPEARPEDPREREQALATWQLEARELADFRHNLPQVRRALANTPTYMVFDDHDVTDDWYLDGAWCAGALHSPLGRRIVRNALYSYALCQAWGNDPDQFDAPNGRSFLAVVDRWRADEAGAQDGADAALLAAHLGLPDAFSGVGTLPRTDRVLRWHFMVETPAYRMLVLDERTRRVYEQPHAAPGVLSEEAMAEQIGAPIPGDGRLTLLVAQTPVLGVSIVATIQFLRRDHYVYDRESWALNARIWQQLLQRLARFGRVVILSGDVHYGYGATLEYWEQAEGSAVCGAATIVNFTSSAFKNAAAGFQKALLTVAYPRLLYLLSQGRLPPVDLFGWDGGTVANTNALAAATQAVRRSMLAVWWSAPRIIALVRSKAALLLPAHPWPAQTFDQCPPARRLRVRYLRDTAQPEPTAAAGKAPTRDGPTASSDDPSASLDTSWDEVVATHEQPMREAGAPLTDQNRFGTQDALELLRLLELAQTTADALHALYDRLNAAVGSRLGEAVQNPAIWTRMWPDGTLHIVGDANIGEVRVEEQVVIQRLWWYPPDGVHGPQPATEYRAELRMPLADEAPPLP
jgi:hypothetical protein